MPPPALPLPRFSFALSGTSDEVGAMKPATPPRSSGPDLVEERPWQETSGEMGRSREELVRSLKRAGYTALPAGHWEFLSALSEPLLGVKRHRE